VLTSPRSIKVCLVGIAQVENSVDPSDSLMKAPGSNP
jgi:hypothetical protein